MSRGICRLCKEEREIFLQEMCDICNEYVTKRAVRYCCDSLMGIFPNESRH